MSRPFTCPHGHRWEAALEDHAAADGPCPVCGAAGRPAPQAPADGVAPTPGATLATRDDIARPEGAAGNATPSAWDGATTTPAAGGAVPTCPARFGRHPVTAVLGEGNFGVVYRGFD